MNNFRAQAVALALAIPLCPSLVAQQHDALPPQARALAGELRIPVHTAEADHGHDYGIWAAGPDYKVSFHDGMTFVPRLGSDYPHNQPLSWRTTSVRRGGDELLQPGERPRHVQADYRYEYRFAAFTEAYDVLACGLEQTFVFATLPGTGDLVITGAVDSLLVAGNVGAAHQELVFHDDAGRPIVRYGKAWVLDARGDEIELTTAHENGKITLRVPAGWLAEAALPIVVDPIFEPATQLWATGGSTGFDEVDIGRDGEASDWNVMVTWTSAFSAVDNDVSAWLWRDDFAGGGTIFNDITTSWSTDHPSCAYVGGADRWALVFRRHFVNTSGRSLLRCHAHDSNDLAVRTNVIGLTPTSGNDWRPDVGGVESYAGGSKALVVFQREHNAGPFADTWASDVYGCLIDLTSPSGAFGTAFPIEASGFVDSERPSVNQVAEGGTAWSWICALQSYNNLSASFSWNVIGRRIGSDGSVAAGQWTPDPVAGTQRLQPFVEGNDGRYAMLYATVGTSIAPGKIPDVAGTRIAIERLDWANGAADPDPVGDQPPVTLASAITRSVTTEGLAFDTNDDSHFVALWDHFAILAPGPRYGIVGYTGELTESGFAFPNVGTFPAACTFDAAANAFRIGVVGSTSTTHQAWGVTLEYNTPAPTALVGPGCSPVVLRWLGNQQIGSETERLTTVGAPAGTGHFVLVALAPANQPITNPAVASGCNLLVSNGPGFLGTLDFQVGSLPSWSFALPPWLPPTTLYFQDWVFDGSQFAATRRLEVPVIR